MTRTTWLILWSAFLLASGLVLPTADGRSFSTEETHPPDDTVYVAEADTMVVLYESRLDTLVVRAQSAADRPLAAAKPTTASSAPASDGASEPAATASAGSDAASPAASRGSASDRSPSPRPARSGLKEGISVSGLVIDQTHSVIGADFQAAFHDYWDPPEDITDYTVRIREQPLPQFGSRLAVRVGETTVFRGQLRPQYRQIDQAARQAAARARYYLTQFYEPREVY